jgi:DNA adenine methylase
MSDDDLFSLLNGLSDHEDQRGDIIVKKPLFNYAGSKLRSLKEILPLLPDRKGFMEPFGGSGVVMLNRKASELDVFNDRNSGITDFYRCIQDPALLEELIVRIRLLPSSRELFVEFKGSWSQLTGIERALRWYYVIMNSFAAQGRNWGRATTPGSGLTISKVWSALPRFRDVHKRFRNVQLDNADFRTLMKDYNDPEMVCYLDPPYVSTAQSMYAHKMKTKDFEELKDCIRDFKGFVALSCYNQCLDFWTADVEWDNYHEWDVTIGVDSTAGNERNNKKGVEKRGKNTEVLIWRDNRGR